MRKKSLLSLPLFVLCLQVHAQSDTVAVPSRANRAQLPANAKLVTGFIKDAVTGKSIESARITYGEQYAGITDSTGHFSIRVPSYNVSIRVEAEGFQSKELALRGEKIVNAKLYQSGYTSVYEDVTTPFDVEPKSHLTTAATSIQTRGTWSNLPETPDAYLQGKVAGLNVIRRSGTPNIGASLFLRGYSSLYATNQPLIIVDGILFDNATFGNSIIAGYSSNPLSNIDLKDIDNISIIKDGSSTYGSKGANGVILITTARATQEATKIDVSLYGNITAAPVNLPVMSTSDYRIYLSEMLQSKGLTYNDVKTLPYMNDDPTSANYYRYHADNNWQDKVFKNSYSQNGYLKITGGDNIAKYALSIGFLKTNDAVINTGLSKYNMRFNADLNLSKRLTAAANLSFVYSDQSLKDFGITPTNPIYTALIKAPFLPEFELSDKGIQSPTLAGADSLGVSNPSALIQGMQANNKSYRFIGSVNFTYKLTNNISLATTIAVSINKIRESFFVPQTGIVSDTLSNAIAKNRSGAQVLRMFSFYNDTRLSYSKIFNDVHHFSASAGVRYNNSKSEQDNGFGFNSATDQFTGVGFGVTSLRQIGGDLGEWAWINTYVNADYNLAGKYFLSLNVASDGSSKFGTDMSGKNALVYKVGQNSYGVFPSLSAAWLVSSENFMAHNSIVDLLKLRASVGLTGNDDLGNFTARKYYTSQNLLGIAGLVRGNIGNPTLQYESVSKLNVGVDAALFNERLNISLDAYHNKTSNMITYEPSTTTTGIDYSVTNSGAMKTSGIEAMVTARVINNKNLKWDVGFNIAHSQSTITKLPVSSILTPFAGGTILTTTGSAPNLFYGYKTNGVYATDAEAAAEGLSVKKGDGSIVPFKGGDVRFVNTNSADKIIDENDRQVIGNPNPDFYGGINTRIAWKNFSLDALFTFTQGNDVYNYTRQQLESMSGYANQIEAVNNRWKTNGQQTNMPKATWGDPMGNSRFSDRWIEDGSYFRLRTLSLTYNIPFKPGFVKNASIYITGNNVFTLTKYLGYDPEFSAASGAIGHGVDVTLEPQYRSAQVGIRLGL